MHVHHARTCHNSRGVSCVVLCFNRRVTACERAKCIDALRARIDSATSQPGWAGEGDGSVTVLQCDWGASYWETQGPALVARGPYDMVIMSELYYDEDTHEDLLWTLQAVCHANGQHPLVIYSGFKNRPYSLQFLALVHDTEEFDVQPIPDEDIDLLGVESSPGDEVLLHKMTYIGSCS